MSRFHIHKIASPIFGLWIMLGVACFAYVFWNRLLSMPNVLLICMSLALSFGHVLLGFDFQRIVRSVRILYGKGEYGIAEIEGAISLFVSATLSEFIGGQFWCLILFMSMMSADITLDGVTQSGLWSIGITSGFSFLLAVVMNRGVRRGRRKLFEINARKSGADDITFKDKGNTSQMVSGCLGAYIAAGILIALSAFLANRMYDASAELQFINRTPEDIYLQVYLQRSDDKENRDGKVYVDKPPVIDAYDTVRLYVRMISNKITGLVVVQLDENGDELKRIKLPLTQQEVAEGSFFNFKVEKFERLKLVSKQNYTKQSEPIQKKNE